MGNDKQHELNELAADFFQTVFEADVVEVVRCKDCKWWNGEQCLARKIEVVDVYDYCSYGERKDDDVEQESVFDQEDGSNDSMGGH